MQFLQSYLPSPPTMPDISAAAVASLRARTGVSILACKKALEEAGGDEEKAIEILRKSGAAQAVKKSAREQKEGAIFIAEAAGKAALVVINCETDFVARNEDFQAMGQKLAETLVKDGNGALVKLAESTIPESVQKLGENISLGETQIIEAKVIGSYVHSNRKIGVLIGLDSGVASFAKDAALHAAAMNPLYVRPEEVSEDLVQKEKEIWKEQLAKEGKPAQIMDKIMMGKEKKFREENALLTQEFVKEPGKTVGEHLKDCVVSKYVRIAIG